MRSFDSSKIDQRGDDHHSDAVQNPVVKVARKPQRGNMQNPHEEKQKALLQRIAGSVTRLNDVLKEINFQIEKSEPLREDLALTCQVWKGYESRVQLHCNAVASTTNGHGKR